MKPCDAAILRRLDEIEQLMHAHVAQTNRRFDHVDQQLAIILKRTGENINLTPELEAAIKSVTLRAISIDEKVPDS